MTLYTAQRAISMAVFVARSVGDVVLLRTGQLSTEECAVRMSRRIEAAGGGAIKIAQLLSTRPDVVGTTVSASLANLQDAVTPMSTKEAQSVMATSGTQWPTSALHAVQDGPVASGSVACVYRWASEEHGDVALKIRRPQALRAIPADVQVLHGALRAAQIIPAIRATPALTMRLIHRVWRHSLEDARDGLLHETIRV